MSHPKFARALPQNVHLLPKGARVNRLCGVMTGAFIRERDSAYLKKFLANGGGLCPECAKLRETPR